MSQESSGQVADKQVGSGLDWDYSLCVHHCYHWHQFNVIRHLWYHFCQWDLYSAIADWTRLISNLVDNWSVWKLCQEPQHLSGHTLWTLKPARLFDISSWFIVALQKYAAIACSVNKCAVAIPPRRECSAGERIVCGCGRKVYNKILLALSATMTFFISISSSYPT